MLDNIKLLYAYNTWATNRLLDSLTQLSPEQYNAPGCSGHGSIKATLKHFLTVQWGWFSWFDGTKTPAEAMAVNIADSEMDSLDKVRKIWQAIDKQTNKFIAGQTEQSLQEHRSFATPNGLSSSLLLGEMVLHVANHGTHTRAQIIAAIRRAGYNPGSYEFLHYLLERKSVKLA